MSFNSNGNFKSYRSFNMGEEPPRPAYWKSLLIATLPAFVASVLPPVVMHMLEQRAARNNPPPVGEQKPEDKKSEPPVTGS